MRVDFTPARRRGRPGRRAGPGDGTARPATGARSGHAVTPEETTVLALAQLIAEKAAPETLEHDIASICVLLSERCGWSFADLVRLRRAATLAHAMRVEAEGPVAAGKPALRSAGRGFPG